MNISLFLKNSSDSVLVVTNNNNYINTITITIIITTTAFIPRFLQGSQGGLHGT